MPVLVFLLLALCCAGMSYSQKSTIASKGKLLLSSYQGRFEEFFAEAIRTGKTAVIDEDFQPNKTIIIEGDLLVVGENQPTIYHNLPQLFLLKGGNHEFRNFNIVQQPSCIAFYTFIEERIIWNNTLKGIQVMGGRQAYASSRGGNYDAKKDIVRQWSGTTIEDCVFKTSYVCVSIFSQDGAAKFLHMRNVDLYCDTAHNLYIHPNVSLRLYGVRSMKVGNPGLAIHHYSGGGGENGKGVISNARYVEIRKCTTNWQPNLKGGMWQIAEPITGVVLMDSCDLAPYAIPLPNMLATNTRFFNGGAGAFVKGKITNCSGSIIPANGTIIDRGNFDELSLTGGGTILVKNSKVKNVFGDKNPVDVTFENTSIEGMKISNPKPSKVLLKKGSKIKNYMWGWKPEPGLVIAEN